MKDVEFADTVTTRIWNGYIARVEKTLRRVPAAKREELVLEIKSHIYESFQNTTTEDEPNKLLTVLENLGDPEEYLSPLIAETLLADASHRFSPRNLLYGLFYNLYRGIYNGIMSIILFIGYLFVAAFGMLAFLKVIIPGKVGLFVNNAGTPEETSSLGFLFAPQGKEILGYWMVPIMLLSATVLFIVLTGILRIYLKPKKKSA
jgi:uncharacterized membrane protein